MSRTVLSADDVRRAVTRIAHEIVERGRDADGEDVLDGATVVEQERTGMLGLQRLEPDARDDLDRSAGRRCPGPLPQEPADGGAGPHPARLLV